MPFPNEHSLRLRPPDIFDEDSFRRTKGGTLFGGNLQVPNTISLIWGKLKRNAAADDPIILQALRFDKSKWTETAAKAWIDKNIKRGIFEPASDTSNNTDKPITDKDLAQAIVQGDIEEYKAGDQIEYTDIESMKSTIEFSDEEEFDSNALLASQLHQLNAEEASTTTTSTASESLAEDSEPETQNLENIEIFQSGVWKDVEYTNQDLDEIAANFIKLKELIKPPVKLGHNEEQELVAKDGMPSAGWITNLKRVGNKLVADINDVPRKIAQIVKNRGYARISSEIYTNLKDSQGTVHGKVLKAIAFLGGDIPHLKSLDDIVAQYDGLDNEYRSVIFMADPKEEVKEEETKTEEEEKKEEEKEETTETTEEEEKEESADEKLEEEVDETKEDKEESVDTDDTKAELAELREKVKAQDEVNTKQAADLKTATGLIGAIQQERLKEKAEKNLLTDETFLDGLSAKGVFPPALRNKGLTVLTEARKSEETVITYAEGEESVETNMLALIKTMFTEWPQGLTFKETARGSKIIHPGDMEEFTQNEKGELVYGENIVEQVAKYMEEHKMEDNDENYSKALIAISRAN